MSTSQIPALTRNDVATPFEHHPMPLPSASMASTTITSMSSKSRAQAADFITVLLALHLSQAVETVQPRLSRMKASVAQSLAKHVADEKAQREAREAKEKAEAIEQEEAEAAGEWWERPMGKCGHGAWREMRLRDEQTGLRILAAERIKEEAAWLGLLEEKLGEAILDLVLMWKAEKGEVA